MAVSVSLLQRWVAACALGEFIGFGLVTVLGGFLAMSLTEGMAAPSRAAVLYAVAVLGGLCEGAVLARFQLRVLRTVWPGLDARRWMVATAMAAALAWAAGMLAPTLDDIIGLTPRQRAAIWSVALVLILLSIGVAQAWVLRSVVGRPYRWLVGNVLGWLAGLPWTLIVPAMLPEDASSALSFTAFIVAGALMGLTTGAITGTYLVRMAAGTTPAGPGHALPAAH